MLLFECLRVCLLVFCGLGAWAYAGARQRRAARVSASGGSLAEQEEAALRLLGAR